MLFNPKGREESKLKTGLKSNHEGMRSNESGAKSKAEGGILNCMLWNAHDSINFPSLSVQKGAAYKRKVNWRRRRGRRKKEVDLTRSCSENK